MIRRTFVDANQSKEYRYWDGYGWGLFEYARTYTTVPAAKGIKTKNDLNHSSIEIVGFTTKESDAVVY